MRTTTQAVANGNGSLLEQGAVAIHP